LNSCLERNSQFPLPIPWQAQPGSSHLKWAPGSLGESLLWLQPPTADAPTRPTSPLPLGPAQWGSGSERESLLSRALHFRIHPSATHTQNGTPPIAPSLGEMGSAGKSAPSLFPRAYAVWGCVANATPWGYSRAGHCGASPGGAPTLPFALNECSLTQAPHPTL
jgi:hypothetical protein